MLSSGCFLLQAPGLMSSSILTGEAGPGGTGKKRTPRPPFLVCPHVVLSSTTQIRTSAERDRKPGPPPAHSWFTARGCCSLDMRTVQGRMGEFRNVQIPHETEQLVSTSQKALHHCRSYWSLPRPVPPTKEKVSCDLFSLSLLAPSKNAKCPQLVNEGLGPETHAPTLIAMNQLHVSWCFLSPCKYRVGEAGLQ